MHKVIIGDNSFIINVNEHIIKLISSHLSKDIEIIEVKDHEINLIKDNAKKIYELLSGYSINEKLNFINEFIELLVKENKKEDE